MGRPRGAPRLRRRGRSGHRTRHRLGGSTECRPLQAELPLQGLPAAESASCSAMSPDRMPMKESTQGRLKGPRGQTRNVSVCACEIADLADEPQIARSEISDRSKGCLPDLGGSNSHPLMNGRGHGARRGDPSVDPKRSRTTSAALLSGGRRQSVRWWAPDQARRIAPATPATPPDPVPTLTRTWPPTWRRRCWGPLAP